MGKCDIKVGRWLEVAEETLPSEMAEGKATVRWLIKREDGAPSFAMRLFTLSPGAHIKPHSHPWEHEIFILEGEGKIRVENQVLKVEKGFFLYIPPNLEHEYWNTGKTPLRFLCMIPHNPTASTNECK